MMIRRTIVAMAMIGMMIATVFATAADNPDKSAKPAKAIEKPKVISNTKSAQCILRISYDPSVLPLNRDMVERLIRSSGVLGKVTKEILGHYEIPPVILEEIGNPGDMIPMGEMGGGMIGGMGMGGDMMGGMGGGMMGMGGFEGGGMTGMAGGGGGMSMPVTPPDVPDAPDMPEDPAAPSTGTAPSPNNAPSDAMREKAQRQMQEAQQRTHEAQMRAMGAQRRAEQLQARIGRSTGYGRQELVDLMPRNGAGSMRDLLLHFEINLEGYVAAANEMMEATIDLLRKALEKQHDQYKRRIEYRIAVAEGQVRDAEEAVLKLQKELRDLSPSKELHHDQLMQEISDCRERIRKIDLEEEMSRAMADNYNKQIEEARKKANLQVAGDPVLKDLEKMLMISQERVATIEKMMAAGQANQNAVQDAMEKLTRANIELAQRREQVGTTAGAERINEMLKRIADISLRTTQNKIQVVRMERQISEMYDMLDRSGTYELLSMRLDLAKQRLADAMRRAASIRDYQPEPPVVEAIGAE